MAHSAHMGSLPLIFIEMWIQRICSVGFKLWEELIKSLFPQCHFDECPGMEACFGGSNSMFTCEVCLCQQQKCLGKWVVQNVKHVKCVHDSNRVMLTCRRWSFITIEGLFVQEQAFILNIAFQKGTAVFVCVHVCVFLCNEHWCIVSAFPLMLERRSLSDVCLKANQLINNLPRML